MSAVTAYGNTTWWGFSPALDLVDILSKYEVELDYKEELNCLLIGAGDGRHILKTISKWRIYDRKMNFYVIENNLEAIARQLLLTNVAMETMDMVGLQEKSELYLELLGNSLLRSSTNDYLCEKANEYIKWITDTDYSKTECSMWNFSHLKYKERDQLEGIFKFWRLKGSGVFDIKEYWNQRLRHHLGIRYDARVNAFDWEYSMKLKEKASIVNWNEYKNWRENGVAFHFRDETAYEVPNKTLASGIVLSQYGERVQKRGYWGDIMNSPYISYGVESSNKSLFKVNNKVHVNTATDVSKFNVTSIIHELSYGSTYSEPDKEGNVIIEEVEDETYCNLSDVLEKVNIHFLPTASVTDLIKKSAYKKKFDIISFSNSMVHLLDGSVSQLFSPNSLLIIESTKFMLELKDELHAEYGKKIVAMATNANCHEIKPFDASQDDVAVFKHNS